MTLVIFSGASDPYHASNAKTYELLTENAKSYGYDNVILPSYDGQKSKISSNKLLVSSSVKIMKDVLDKLEKNQIPYRIVALSFGTFVLMELLKNQIYNYLTKVIMWGSAPYYKYYELLIKNEEDNTKRLLECGTVIDKNVFSEIYPFELSLKELNNINFPLIITSGVNDSLYPESFRISLMEENKNTNISFLSRIENLGHSVKEYNKVYLDLLLRRDT